MVDREVSRATVSDANKLERLCKVNITDDLVSPVAPRYDPAFRIASLMIGGIGSSLRNILKYCVKPSMFLSFGSLN